MKASKAAKIFGISLLIAADMSGIPYSSKITKLAEEMLKSEVRMRQSMTESAYLQFGKVIGGIDTAQRALEYYFCEDLSEEMRLKQLNRAWEKFENAYSLLNHLPRFANYKPRVALSVAICHGLLDHPNLAKDWAEKALEDNKQFHSLDEYDLSVASKILSPQFLLGE